MAQWLKSSWKGPHLFLEGPSSEPILGLCVCLCVCKTRIAKKYWETVSLWQYGVVWNHCVGQFIPVFHNCCAHSTDVLFSSCYNLKPHHKENRTHTVNQFIGSQVLKQQKMHEKEQGLRMNCLDALNIDLMVAKSTLSCVATTKKLTPYYTTYYCFLELRRWWA